MDLGVGAVMLTGALVRRRARAKPAGRSDSAWRVCRRHAPLVAIGVGRLLAVKAADYHEVVTPWAVHRLTPPHTPSGPPTSPPAPSSAYIAPHTRAGRERVWHPLELLLHARARRGGGGSCDASLGAGHCAVRGRPAPAAPGGAPLRPRAVGRARAAARAPEREQGVARPSTPAASRRARARALPDQPAPGCARSAAGGAGLPTRLPRRLVAWRRHRRGLAPARRGSQLVARPGGARPPHPRAGRRRAAHASAPRTPRPAAHACGGADAWVGGPTLPPAVRSVIHCRRRGAAGVATAVQPGLLALGRRAGAQSARAQLHARAPSRCACSPQTLLVLCICLATSLVCPAPAPDLLGALNRHLLGVFLLANLLTGAVNLTLPTMHASGPFGLCVLCVYMTAVCAAACAAEGPRRDATVRASP